MSEVKEQPPLLDNPYFEVLVSCNIHPSQLIIVQNQQTTHTPLFNKLNDDNWEKEMEHARAKGQDSQNRPQFTLQSATMENGKLKLMVSRTDWKTFRFTRNPKIREQFPQETTDILGANILIRTADDKLIFVRRSQKGLYKPGVASTIGGYPDIDEDIDENGRWDPFKTISRELEEETSIKSAEITSLILTGVIYNKDQTSPNLAFFAQTSLTEQELREDLTSGQRKTDKEVDLKFIPDTKEELRNLSLWYAMANSPAGISTLAFYSRQKYGQGFLDLLNSRLNRRAKIYQTFTKDQQQKVQEKASKRLSRFSSVKLQD